MLLVGLAILVGAAGRKCWICSSRHGEFVACGSIVYFV